MTDFIMASLLPSLDPLIIGAIIAIFLFAGLIKGFLGLGLPAAAMALLTLIFEPTEAIALLSLPIIVTNLYQFSRSEDRLETARRYKVFALAIIISIFVTAWHITVFPTEILTSVIGVAMITFASQWLFGLSFSIGTGAGWQLGAGVMAGILGGLSSIWSPPVVMYLMARKAPKESFIAATGFLFLVGSFPLAVGLFMSGVLTIVAVIKSLLGLGAALIGFRIGETLRAHVSQDTFRKAVLIAFMIMGARLVFNGLV
ncbi:sulfite exporter TauE/SafE family protein [Candidatus Puniceispirillum sp.]|uniref:sulfite exporter TauE/SafE family protein n=1 Tax=Candidatus Puniceispirillum sp. TaxID=2026719 RepID=UPI003F6A355D